MEPAGHLHLKEDPFRVMIVDDSAVIRGFITRWLSGEPGIQVVGSAANGVMALKQVERLDPDVVILDIEMPELDGLSALPKLLEIAPDLKVIMASTLTARGAEVSLKALSLGAADYIPKPMSTREAEAAETFRLELIAKINALAKARRSNSARQTNQNTVLSPVASSLLAGQGTKIILRPASKQPIRILSIASSTGGPQALFQLFSVLKNTINLPILITQHMPPTFTKILAEHLQKISGLECREACAGELVHSNRIYVAPGDWHMSVQIESGEMRLQLDQNPPENFCRPAADPMLRSLAQAYGSHVLAIILTGMGSDGLKGARAVTEAGGTIIAQDEASSVVWGMPGAVATAGLCSAVLPLSELAPAVTRMTLGAAA